MRLTYGSLFSGVGGFDLGFDQAGYDCVFQVEWDKHCQQILARHWPDVPRWTDVQHVNGAELPPCDVLTFGSPCQDLSVAGKRAGLDGNKSSMFFEATRIIKEMRDATGNRYPRIAVWENVPGALSSNRGADFQAVLNEMGDCGALEQEWAVLDAQHFGVPQRRRRIFLVAVFDPAIAGRCASQILPVSEGSRRNTQKSNQERQNIASTFGDGSGNSGWSPDTDRMTFVPVGFSHTQGLDAQPSEQAFPTLRSEGGGHAVMQAIPIQDGREIEKKQNGIGIGREGDPAYTLDTTGAQAIAQAIPIQGTIIGRSDSAGPRGKGIGEPGSAMYTLDTISQHGVAQPFVKVIRPASDQHPEVWREEETAPTLNAFDNGGESRATVVMPVIFTQNQRDEVRNLDGVAGCLQANAGMHLTNYVAQPVVFENSYRDGPRIGKGVSHTLPAKMGTGGGNTPMVAENSYAVRRLTPIECERLMGWPDDHTRWKADGTEQADSHRYKQCGNGVATPVAKWVAEQIRRII